MLIFKTNVDSPSDAAEIIKRLGQSLSIPLEASFDLEDCDRVLRLHATSPLEELVRKVSEVVNSAGFKAEILQDEVFEGKIPKHQRKLSLQLLCSFI